jgi:hypothetical protein
LLPTTGLLPETSQTLAIKIVLNESFLKKGVQISGKQGIMQTALLNIFLPSRKVGSVLSFQI